LNYKDLARVSMRVRRVRRRDANEGAVGDSAEELRAQAGGLAGIFVRRSVLEHGLKLIGGDECGCIGGNRRASLTTLPLALAKSDRGKPYRAEKNCCNQDRVTHKSLQFYLLRLAFNEPVHLNGRL
jgi:hypothetical protein